MPLEYVNSKPVINGIPRGSTLCISSLPSRREVINTRANGSYTPGELDPGKYVYCVQKHPLFNNPGRAWTERGEFLVDVNEEEYQRLLFIRPRYSRSIATTQGARWTCGIANCSEAFTSIIAIVQHEGEHLGIDFLHTTIDEADAALFRAVQSKTVSQQEPGLVPRPARATTPAEVIDAKEAELRETAKASIPHTAADRTVLPPR